MKKGWRALDGKEREQPWRDGRSESAAHDYTGRANITTNRQPRFFQGSALHYL